MSGSGDQVRPITLDLPMPSTEPPVGIWQLHSFERMGQSQDRVSPLRKYESGRCEWDWSTGPGISVAVGGDLLDSGAVRRDGGDAMG